MSSETTTSNYRFDVPDASNATTQVDDVEIVLCRSAAVRLVKRLLNQLLEQRDHDQFAIVLSGTLTWTDTE